MQVIAKTLIVIAITLTASLKCDAQQEVTPEFIRQSNIDFWTGRVAKLPFPQDRLELWIEQAGPDEQMRDGVQRKFDAFRDEFKALGERFMERAKVVADRAARRFEQMDMSLDPMSVEISLDWIREVRQLERSFVISVADMLEGEAEEIWWAVDRGARRERLMPELVLTDRAHSTFDLIAIAEGLDLSERDQFEIAAHLFDFGVELDELIVKWNELQGQMQAPGGGAQDQDELQELAQRLMQLRADIWEVCRRYAQTIIAALSPPSAKEFRLAIEEVRYPHLFSESPVEIVNRTLYDRGTLAGDTKRVFDEVFNAYADQAEALRTQAIDAAGRYWLPAAVEDRNKRYEQGLSREEVDGVHPSTVFVERRRRLEAQTLRELGQILQSIPESKLPPVVRVLLTWGAQWNPPRG